MLPFVNVADDFAQAGAIEHKESLFSLTDGFCEIVE